MRCEKLEVRGEKNLTSNLSQLTSNLVHLKIIKHGGVAQLARAPALQAGGQEFDSPHLHQMRSKKWEGRRKNIKIQIDYNSLNFRRKI